MNLLDRLLDWLLSRCPHNPDHVTADLAESASPDTQLQWCQRCGAVRWVRGYNLGGLPLPHVGWRRPRPLWCEPRRRK